jgi:Kef-type K+ transport system membrane component KefB
MSAGQVQRAGPFGPVVRSAGSRLFLLLLVMAAVSALGLMRAEQGTPVTFAGGALLLSAIFAGKLAASFGLPRLTGYLVVGIVVGPYALGFITPDGVSGLNLVKGLAVSLIALAAGTELELGLLRRVGMRVLIMCALVAGVVFLLVGGVLVALRPLLSFMDGMSWPQVVAVAALTSSVVISFSPTVTIAIVQETEAKGPFTEFLMAFVIIGDLLVLIVFALAAGFTRAAFGGGLDVAGLLGGIGWELFGSMIFGAVLGVVTLVYLRKVRTEVPLFIVALCFVSAEAGMGLHLSPLLLSLAAGALIANLDEREAHKLHDAIQTAGLPVFALFFAVAGAGLHLDTLGTVGPVAVLLVVIRGVGLWLTCQRFAPQEPEQVRKFLWMGLISQAGVTFGLAALVARTFPNFGADVEVLVVAMVTLHELIGPVLTRRALQKTGEAAAVDPGAATR